jgi:amino acid transporter
MMNYFQSPATVLPVIVFAVVIAICVLPKFRGNLQSASSCGHVTGIILGLLAYTVVRGTFFFIFNPPEPLLFSPAVTLAHLLIIGIAFVASTFFRKTAGAGYADRRIDRCKWQFHPDPRSR